MYDKFISMLGSSVYSFCANGRVQAVNDLRVNQEPELGTRGFVYSTVFKTNSKYGEQPVSFEHKVVKYLLHVYMSHFRPKLCTQPNDPLFITFTGTPYDIGRGVSRFFHASLQLSITTTLIRSLVETNMDRLLKEGHISAVHRGAVMNINGHTSQVCKDYYIHDDRVADRINSAIAFQTWVDVEKGIQRSPPVIPVTKLKTFVAPATTAMCTTVLAVSPIVTPSLDMLDVCIDAILPASPRDEIDYLENTSPLSMSSHVSMTFEEEYNLMESEVKIFEFGSNHPNQDKYAKRVKWTDTEIKIVGRWCDLHQETNPEWKNIIVSKCLAFVKQDENACKYFHINHVSDSTKFRHAYTEWKVRLKEVTKE